MFPALGGGLRGPVLQQLGQVQVGVGPTRRQFELAGGREISLVEIEQSVLHQLDRIVLVELVANQGPFRGGTGCGVVVRRLLLLQSGSRLQSHHFPCGEWCMSRHCIFGNDAILVFEFVLGSSDGLGGPSR